MDSIVMRLDGSQSINRNNFTLSYSLENIHTQHIANVPVLTIYGTLKPTSPLEADLQEGTLELFSLSGTLVYNSLSVPMRPLTDIQGGLLGENGFSVPLAFELTTSQLRYLEQERQKSPPKGDLVFTIFLRGSVLVKLASANAMGSLRFTQIATVTTPTFPMVRIARSDWLDTMLPGLGYDETLLVELPLPKYPTVSEQVAGAVQKLEIARQRLRDEHYRDAVHYCRQAKDALTDRDATALMAMLEPYVGTKKAKTVDDVLRAFGSFYTASSHANPSTLPADERLEFTLDEAELAVNTLAFVLHYVAQTLHTQGITTP